MSRYVVDASVAVKWFVPEIHSREAAMLLEGAHALCAPDLLFAEVINTLWKKTCRRELRLGEVRLIMRGLGSVPFEVTAARDLMAAALDLALHVGCTAYDALYLALAIHHDCHLVTADRRLRDRLGRRALSRYVSVLPGVD